METKETDRRARGVKRVDFSTLVEICGRSGNTPAFEAEAIELSGRGMQVRTDFLPDLGAPLVLRFDAGDHEAVIEGEVAWRRENDNGGEFGIKFTAVDSNSVRVLKEICAGTLKPAVSEKSTSSKDDDAPERPPVAPGAPVRLHIQGLGAPMKARVFESRGGRLHVGSQLEFLKVGRALELEEGDGGDKRPAEIDSVTVSIDPQTQIPQLIVSLCYESDDTPEPSVVDGERDAGRKVEPRHRPAPRDQRASRDVRRAAPAKGDDDEAVDDEELDRDEDAEESEDLFKGRFAAWASSAGSAVAKSGAGVAKFGASATRGLASLFGSATQKVAQAQKDRNPRRTSTTRSSVATSAKGVARSGGLKDKPRPQRSLHGKGQETEAPSRKKRVVVAALALLVCASGVYPLFIAHDEKRAPAPAGPVVQAAPPAQVTAAPPLPLGSAFPVATVLDTNAQLAAGPGPVSVDVPLFGTQQLSTLEAAPLTPPPQTAIDEVSMAKDQTFAQPVVPSLAKVAAAEGAAEEPAAAEAPTPTGNTVWQAGKMHLPIVHRLRLDAPGTELQGTDTPSGFSVMIPGRKVMETGAQIAKRDDRILSVNVKNTPAGAQVVFRFRKGVPGHKVRLRNDYIEFFVNSEEQ